MMEDDAAGHVAPDCSARLRTMAGIARRAGRIAREGLCRRMPADIVAKGPRDYQTEMDVAVEAAIARELARAFPDHAIAGEEGAADRVGVEDAPRIVIDPIDGTTNFAWGIPHFGLTIAIVERGQVTAGVVHDPMLDEMFSAEAGQGAHLGGVRLRMPPTGEIADALVGASLPMPGQVRSVPVEAYHRALRRLMDNVAGVRRLGSAALSIAYVAAGRFDGYFEDGLSLHDWGAAGLIVREAGGVVTGLDGGEAGARGVLAATPELHPWLLEGLRG